MKKYFTIVKLCAVCGKEGRPTGSSNHHCAQATFGIALVYPLFIFGAQGCAVTAQNHVP